MPPKSDQETTMEEDEIMNNNNITDGNNNDDDGECDDTSPAFVDMSSAVVVDDDNDGIEPISDDDESAAIIPDDDTSMMEDDENNDNTATTSPPPLDMSLATISCHSDSVYTVAIDGNGGGGDDIVILSGGGDDKAYATRLTNNNDDNNTAESSSILLDHAHSDTVSCIAVNSKCGNVVKKLIAVGSYDGTIVIYDAVDGTKLTVLEGPGDVEWLDWHPKGGTVLLAGSTDGTLWMYHLYQKNPTTTLESKVLQVFVGHSNDVTCGRFTPDGKFVLSCGTDGTMKIWAPKTGGCKVTFKDNFAEAPMTCMDATTDGSIGLVGCEDGSCVLVGLAAGARKVVGRFRHVDGDGSVECVGFGDATGRKWCATGGSDGTLKIWDWAAAGDRAQCRHVCRHGEDGKVVVTRLKWHPVHPLVFASGSDGVVRVWDARSGRCVVTLTGHVDTINDLAVEFVESKREDGSNHEKALIVTGGDDRTVKVFEVDVGAILSGAIGGGDAMMKE